MSKPPRCGISPKQAMTCEGHCVSCAHRTAVDRLACASCTAPYNPETGECPNCNWEPVGQPTAKADTGKPRLALVPPAIIEAVGVIRTYGTDKYGDPDNWRQVEPWRYKDALMRHLVEWLRDDKAVDSESGYPHLWHAACNIAFLLEIERNNLEGVAG